MNALFGLMLLLLGMGQGFPDAYRTSVTTRYVTSSIHGTMGQYPKDGWAGFLTAVMNRKGQLVQFTNCEFEKCATTAEQVPGGGAVYAYNVMTLTFESCSFDEMTSDKKGGAICTVTEGEGWACTLTIRFSKFVSCTAETGALIHGTVYDSTGDFGSGLVFENNTVSECTSTTDHSPGSLISISKLKTLSFSGNTFDCQLTINADPGKETGSAIDLTCPSQAVSITDCWFKNTGAVLRKYIDFRDVASESFERCNFTNMGCPQFGHCAIWCENFVPLSVSNCEFVALAGGRKGLAIMAESATEVTISECLFKQCTTSHPASSGEIAGGLIFASYAFSSFTIKNCDFVDVQDHQGQCQGINLQCSTDQSASEQQITCEWLTFTFSTEQKETTRPLLYIGRLGDQPTPAQKITIAHCLLEGGLVKEDKGISFIWSQGEVVYDNCIFRTNSVSDPASGLLPLASPTQTFKSCVFEDCSALTGAVFFKHPSVVSISALTFTGCTFNVTEAQKGVVGDGIEIATLSFSECVFDRVNQEVTGFLINAGSESQRIGSVSLKQCDILDCKLSKGSGGSGFHIYTETLTLDHVTTEESYVSFLLDSTGSISLSDCHFRLCRNADSHFLSISAATATLQQCDFSVALRVETITTSNVLLMKTTGATSVSDCDFAFWDSKATLVSVSAAAQTKFEHCGFAFGKMTAGTVIESPMISYSGSAAASDLQFYNCCFIHGEGVSPVEEKPMYMRLSGQGKVTFSMTCFDAAQNESIESSNYISIEYMDSETQMFGNCECSVPIPSEPEPEPEPEPQDKGEPSNAGAIAGGVIGALIVVAAVVVFVVWWLRRRPPTTSECQDDEEAVEEEPATTNTETVQSALDFHVTTDNGFFNETQAVPDMENFGFGE